MSLRHCKSCTCEHHAPRCQGRCDKCHPEAPFSEAESVTAFALQLAAGVRANQLGKYRAVLHDGTIVDVRLAASRVEVRQIFKDGHPFYWVYDEDGNYLEMFDYRRNAMRFGKGLNRGPVRYVKAKARP